MSTKRRQPKTVGLAGAQQTPHRLAGRRKRKLTIEEARWRVAESIGARRREMVARHFLLNLTELSGATVDKLAALNEYVVKETWKTLYGHDRRMYRILRAGVDRYETLTRVTGGSLSNWAQGAKPSRATVKRMAEFRMLFTALESLVYPRSINFWLRAPNPSFAGATPLQIIERGEAKRIWRLILVQELESGMPTTEQPCRIEPECVALLTRQARRRKLDVATPNSLYLKEKTLEEEYPGIGFRDSAFGREAYVQGHRVLNRHRDSNGSESPRFFPKARTRA